jgi:hypothetical protein
MKNNCNHPIIFLLLLAYFVIIPRCNAQEINSFANKGVVELGGSFSYARTTYVYQSLEEFTYNTLSLLPYVGYFIIDNLEIGLNPISVQSNWNSGYTEYFTTALLAPAYNFRAGRNLYPFIEAQFGYTSQIVTGSLAYLNPKRDGFSWGGRAGIKLVTVEKCLLNIGLQYQQIALNENKNTARHGMNTLLFSVGFTFWF